MKTRTALITGASRGIGQAIAVSLAQNGYKRLILTSKTREKLGETAKLINDLNLNCEVYMVELDIQNTAQVAGTLAQIWKDISTIDLLVNCAGIASQSNFFNINLSVLKKELSTNLLGLYTVTQIIGKRMVSQGSGTIVNVSSLAGVIPAPGLSGYSATKAAINGFTRALRAELAHTGVKVVLLLPTLVKSDMSASITTNFGVKAITPKEVADALVEGLARNQREIVVGRQAKIAVWLSQFCPAFTQWVARITSRLDPLYFRRVS